MRKSTAQQLYLKILGEDLPRADEAGEILLNTAWDDSLDKAEAAQQAIQGILLSQQGVTAC